MGLDMYMYKVRSNEKGMPRLVEDYTREEAPWYFLEYPDGKRIGVTENYVSGQGPDRGYWEMSDSAGNVIPRGTYVDRLFNEDFYWRKFNALHGWMVDNYEGHNDDCEPHEITIDTFYKLLDTLQKVSDYKKYLKPVEGEFDYKRVEDKNAINELNNLFPTTSGFFFGGQDYDNYYFEDVDDTLKNMKATIPEIKNGDVTGFVYHASW